MAFAHTNAPTHKIGLLSVMIGQIIHSARRVFARGKIMLKVVPRPDKPSLSPALEALTAAAVRTAEAVRECTARKDKVVADARERLEAAKEAQAAGLDAGKGADRSLEVLAATQALQAAQDAADRLGPQLEALQREQAQAAAELDQARRDRIADTAIAYGREAAELIRQARVLTAKGRGLAAALRLQGHHGEVTRILAETEISAPTVEAERKVLMALEERWFRGAGEVAEGREP